VLAEVLVAAAVVAGITGAWSPCGFSMVETLAPHGYAGRLRTTVAACTTFLVGALAGGIITFGGLALVGETLGAGGSAAIGVAAVIAIAAAMGEARGARIVPQVRRQVPESWRRVMPVPLAAGLYGVLLGLGFTTFILSFAVWALAGVSVALGDPGLGLLVGLGFGIGRALPVLALAPTAGTEAGSRAHAAMAERAAILRRLRWVDAIALSITAAALTSSSAQAAAAAPIALAARARVLALNAADPSADADRVAWHQAGTTGVLSRAGTLEPLPGAHPAVGGDRIAWIADGAIEVRAATGEQSEITLAAPGADALAVSANWVAWRTRVQFDDIILAVSLAAPGEAPRQLASQRGPGQLGRPSLAGDLLLYHRVKPTSSQLEAIDLASGGGSVLRRETRALLLNPSALGDRLLYVRSVYSRQQLRLGGLRRTRTARDRVIYSTVPTGRRDAGYEPGAEHHRHGHPRKMWKRPRKGVQDTLWSTALAADAAYVTRVRQQTGAGATALILRVEGEIPPVR
jgi:hypothetical protein